MLDGGIFEFVYQDDASTTDTHFEVTVNERRVMPDLLKIQSSTPKVKRGETTTIGLNSIVFKATDDLYLLDLAKRNCSSYERPDMKQELPSGGYLDPLACTTDMLLKNVIERTGCDLWFHEKQEGVPICTPSQNILYRYGTVFWGES